MALLGSFSDGNGQSREVSNYNVWTIVHEVEAAKIPSSLVAFVTTGSVGRFSWTPGSAIGRHQIEIALASRTSAGPLRAIDQRDVVRLALEDGALAKGAPNGDDEAAPFQIVTVLDPLAGSVGTHPQFGNAWNVGDSLVVLARFLDNGDGFRGASCYVGDVTVTVFDLAQLNAELVPYVADEFAPTGPIPAGGPSSGPVILDPGSQVLGSPDETWLAFYSFTYQAFASFGGPRLGPFHNYDATTGLVRDEQGLDGVPHPAGVPVWLDNTRQALTGGFAVVTQGDVGASPPNNFYRLGWSARDTYDAGAAGRPTQQTQIKRASYFAVRLRDAAGVEDFYDVKIDDGDPFGISPVSPVFREVPKPGQPFEVTVDAPTLYVTFHQARTGNPRSAPPSSYRAFVTGDLLTPLLATHIHNTTTRWPQELTPFAVHFQPRGLGQDVRFELQWWSGIANSSTAADASGYFWRTVGFYFETDPSNTPRDLPAVAPAVVIVPGRETLDPSDLPVLPRTPARELEELQEVPGYTFRADSGYSWRLPKFTAPRRSFALEFPGLDHLERVALADFFRTSPAFAWAPPGESATAWLVVERPQISEDSAKLATLTVRVAELVFTDPPIP